MEPGQSAPVGPQGPPRASGPGQSPGFRCASFNQDSTSLALGTQWGYGLFSLTSVDVLDCLYHSYTPNVCLVERLFSSSLVVVVRANEPQRINIYHFKKNTEICNYSYPHPVRSVKLNRQRLVVCLEDSIYIHNIKDMKLLQTLPDLAPNPTGLCALSVPSAGCESYLAFPSSLSSGELQLYNAGALVLSSLFL